MISYDVGTSIITVTGYSLLTPCDFTDLYNADKAGSLSLHARTGVSVSDGADVVVDESLMPADYTVLGGTSNDLYITITNWSGLLQSATIKITGTDRAGNSLTEDISFSANGSYYTTKQFKTITHTKATVPLTTSFDYDLIQGQWGVVWKLSETLFRTVGIYLMLGDASNDAYFGDTKKTIEVYKMPDFTFFFDSPLDKGHLYLGEVASVSDKTGKNGCSFKMESPDMLMDQGFTNRLAELYMYDTKIIGDYEVATMMRLEGTDGRIWQSLFTKVYLTANAGNLDVYNIVLSDAFLGLLYFSTTGVMDKIQILDNLHTVIQAPTTVSSTCLNLYIRNFVSNLFSIGNGTTASHYLIDADIDWSLVLISWHSSPLCILYRQHTFNLKITDKVGNNINGATVKVWDKDDSLIVNTTTAGGVIVEQIVTRGYYNQANGNSLQDKSPHTIKIAKAGYQTYINDFTLDKEINWLIRLKRIAINIDNEVIN